MRAITICQPWASLSIHGCKPYEFRHWSPPKSLIGQRVVLHAAVKKIDKAQIRFLRSISKRDTSARAALCLQDYDKAKNILTSMMNDSFDMLGVGLGTTVLGEPKTMDEIKDEFQTERTIYGRYGGHYKPLRAWPLLDIEKFDEPIAARGKQNFWHWPSPEDVCL